MEVWTRCLVWLLALLAASGQGNNVRVLPNEDTAAEKTPDRGRSDALVVLQLRLELSKAKTAMLATEQRLSSSVDSKLATFSNRVDIALLKAEHRMMAYIDSRLSALDNQWNKDKMIRCSSGVNAGDSHKTQPTRIENNGTEEQQSLQPDGVSRAEVNKYCDQKIADAEGKLQKEMKDHKEELQAFVLKSLSNLSLSLENALKEQQNSLSEMKTIVGRLNQTMQHYSQHKVLTDGRLQQLEQALQNRSSIHTEKSAKVEQNDTGPAFPPIPEAARNATVFFVALKTNKTGKGTVVFEKVFDVNNDYSSYGDSRAPSGGYYYHSVSFAAESRISSGLYLKKSGGTYENSLYLASARGKGIDMTSKHCISNASKFTIETARSLYSSQLMQVSWTAIGLSGAMRNLVAFSLSRTSGYEGTANPLRFQRNLIAVGGGIGPSLETFTVPRSGIYLLSLSLETFDYKPLQVALVKGSTNLFHFGRTSALHTSADTLSKTIIVPLLRGDTINVKLCRHNTTIWSNANFRNSQSLFSGFRYDPVHGAPIAWTLARTLSINDVSISQQTLDFDRVVLNQGHAWNATAKAIRAPLAGYYYIHLSCGLLPGKPSHLYVNVNGQPFVDLWRQTTHHNGYDFISRSALLRLNATDLVTVTAARGSGIHSDSGLQTAFAGLLVYREE